MIKEMTYFTKQVADILGVKAVTVRSWAPKFEERGHKFLENNGSRAFRKSDIALFRRYLYNTQELGMSQSEAIDAALATPIESTNIVPITPHDTTLVTPSDEYLRNMEAQLETLSDTVASLTEAVKSMADRSDANARTIADALAQQQEQIAAVAATVQSLPAAKMEAAPKREYWWSRFVRDFREGMNDV